jgi:hypothetical protein
VKRTGRGKSIESVIHIHMGIAQGNSLCSYLYLRLAKCHISPSVFYVYSSTKSESRRAEQVLSGGGERCGSGQLAPVGRGMWGRQG